MGLHDLYPFVLGPAAVTKLAFVHRLIGAMWPATSKTRARRDRQTAPRRLRSEAM
jgi:hypothetical protein